MSTKIKFNSSVCAGLALASLFLNAASAQDIAAKIGNVSVVSVDRMSLTNSGTAYSLAVDITFQNRNSESLKFKRGEMQIVLRNVRPDGTNELIDLGPSHLDDVVLPGGTNNNPGTVTTTADVVLGSTNEATTAKMVQLFNAITDPRNKVSLLLNGSSELGIQVPHGWVYDGLRHAFEGEVTPSFQPKALIN